MTKTRKKSEQLLVCLDERLEPMVLDARPEKRALFLMIKDTGGPKDVCRKTEDESFGRTRPHDDPLSRALDLN